MKRLLTFVLLVAMLPLFAQNHTEKCATSKITQARAAADPQYAAELQQMHAAMLAYAQTQHASPRAIRTISVAVHVLYNTGVAAQNIPTSYITDMIQTMNEDYGYYNSDTNQVRAAFKSVRGNAQIQFCLDTIIRKSITKTCFDENTESDDMKFNSSGGDNSYDPAHYLNIWVTQLCGSSATSGTAGYTVFPSTGVAGSAYDGVVLDYRLAFFNISHGLSTPDRVGSHETGHYFGLEHPWGNGSLGAACGDDGFSDTPVTDGTFNCATNTNCTASPGSQYENIMDYSDCPHMFSAMQAAEMNRVLTQTRSSLLSSPGCSNTPSAPIADFTSNKTSVCPGSSVKFTDATAGAPTSWAWTFTGGTPATSALQNPTVTYTVAGTYTVKLVASNGNGSNTVTKTAYITVQGTNALPLAEGFQATTFPPAGWTLKNPDGATTFVRTATVGGYGTSTASVKYDCFNNSNAGDQDLLMSNNYNFTNVTNAKLKFDYAYAQYNSTYADTLYVIFSNNCGDSTYLLQVKGGPTLATAPNTTTAFTPTATQWKTDTIDLSFLAGQASVQVGFVVVNRYGNNIYLDNVNMYVPAATTPVANFSGTPTTVVAGGTVNFTDLSTNGPTSWAWSFPGAVTTTSTVKNPTGIQYNNVGTYNVTLVASNSAGLNSVTKTAYINVVASVPAGCDTLDNFVAGDSLTIYLADTTAKPGYLSGHNKWGDLAKADVFTAPVNGYQLKGSYFLFGVAKYASAASKIKVKAYSNNGTAGAPGTVLDSVDVLINSLSTTNLTWVAFPHTPTISGTFYVGIEFTYAAGDTVALYTNKVKTTHTVNTGWEKDGASVWAPYTTNWGVNTKLSNFISPVLCSASSTPITPVADFSGTPTTVVVGNSVAFTDLSTNTPTSWNWSFPGAVTTTSTTQNPTIQYNTVGTYNVSLTAANSAGSNNKTKTAYINVVAATVGCDTLDNFVAGDSLTIYLADTSAIPGYLSGHNIWGDLAKADVFTAPTNGDQLKGSYFLFGVAKFASPSSKIRVKAWSNNGTGGAPGTVLDSTDVLISSLSTTNLTWVPFPHTPTINGTFYVGIELTYATGDTVALYTNKVKPIHTVNTGWEKDANGVWAPYTTNWGATTILSNFISPVLCSPTTGTPPVANFAGTPTTVCRGGSVTFTDQSTNTPTSWAWTFAGGTPATSTLQNPTVTYATAGTYAVTLIATNSSGNNTKTVAAYITVKAPPTITATATDVTCPGGNNGSVTTNVTGGTTPYTYRWSNNTTNANLNNVAGAIYTVTVSDAAGCSATTAAVVNEPIIITMSVVGTNATCGQANGAATATAAGGTPPFTYNWSNSQTGGTISGLTANTYSVTATDAHGCTKVGSVTITSSGALTLNFVPTATTCGGSNGSITVNTTGGAQPFTYAWSNGQSTATVSGLASGTYSVTVHDNSGCSATGSSNVAASTAISATASATQANCGSSNGTATVTPSGGSGYSFHWGNGQSTATATGLAAGNYGVTVTATGGCTATATASVSNTGGPTVSVSNLVNVLCYGGNNGSISLAVSGGNGTYSYLWSSGQSIQNISTLTAGTYNVSVTSNGCVTTASGTVTQPAALVANASPQAVTCFGGGNGAATVQVSGGTPSYSYLWSNNNTSATASGLSAGLFTVTITDQHSCSATTSVNIAQPTQLSITVNGSNPGCTTNNGSVAASVFGGTPNYTYAWNTSSTNNSLSGLAAGTYTVTATDAHACTVSRSVTLNTQSAPTITTSSTSVSCGGNGDGTASVNVTSGAGAYTYRWSNNQTTQNLSGLSAGSYSVTVTDGGGCSVAGTITVGSANFTVSDNVTNIAGCHGGTTGSIALAVTGGSGTFTYHWSNNTTSASIFTLPAGSYSVTVTDVTGGCTVAETYTVTEPSEISATATSTSTIQNASTGTASVNAAGGNGTYTYSWGTGQTTPSITALAAGTYTVTVTDGSGCSTTASTTVTSTVGVVNVGQDFKFEVYPNPNNGRFQVNLVFGQSTTCTIQVYNTIGELVYSIEKNNLLEDNFNIDLSNFASSTYFVRLVSNDHNLVKKVTVLK